MPLVRKLLFAVAVCWAANATAAPTLLFSAQRQAGSTELIDFVVRAQAFSSFGLAGVHLDLGYDTATLSLVSATAGGFFGLNAPGSRWSDTVALELAPGNAVDSNVIDATPGPDVLGFDLVETTGLASTVEGELLRMVFRFTGNGLAQFTTNDGLMVDGIGNATFLSRQTITVGGTNNVPEPGVLALVALGMFALALCRRKT